MSKELKYWQIFSLIVSLLWVVSMGLANFALGDLTNLAQERIKGANDVILACEGPVEGRYLQEVVNLRSSLDVCWRTARRIARSYE